LRRKAVGADPSDEQLTVTTGVPRPTDWHGNFLLYEQAAPGTAWDLWYLPLAAPRKPVIFLNSTASEVQGQLSAEGQWLAYTSDESGTLEVYARSFRLPALSSRSRQVVARSQSGGAMARRFSI
jgi:Tol biopolymer transport system component